WVRRLLETQQDSEAQDFFHDLKIDMFADEAFVFTPKGDVINLPAGATPIDFAYAIHSAVGNRMTGAKVNGRIVPLSAVLHNGDIVEVLTAKNAPGPSRDWLKLAKSGEARSKIKQWFKKEKREENIQQGREMFAGELKRAGLGMADVLDEEVLPAVLKRVAVVSLDDMFASIGYGGMTALRAVNRIKDEILRLKQSAPRDPLQVYEELTERNEKLQKKKQRAAKGSSGVMVEGLDSFLVKFARCCTPVPGDDIVGYVTRGAGVSVHRRDCPNYLGSLGDPAEEGRWVKVSWAEERDEGHLTTLKLAAKDRNDLVVDIATALSAMSARVRGLSARSGSRGLATVSVTVEVKDVNELSAVVARLSKIPDVNEVKRGQ
ncbi:MAG: TGS domain-containing protein, partial [Defluviitaleaceae bacterium]|nr:TGS domain-containing protein [Defluviitaleaceae bacterium]